jgi:hypothetical protein
MMGSFTYGRPGIVWIRNMGTVQEDERHAGRFSPSMRETNDEAVHTPRPETEGEWITPGRRHVGSGWLPP